MLVRSLFFALPKGLRKGASLGSFRLWGLRKTFGLGFDEKQVFGDVCTGFCVCFGSPPGLTMSVSVVDD